METRQVLGSPRLAPASTPSPVTPNHAQRWGGEVSREGREWWAGAGGSCTGQGASRALSSSHLALISPRGSMCEGTAGSCLPGLPRELQDTAPRAPPGLLLQAAETRSQIPVLGGPRVS